ncbi:MAG TPA: glycosyltransferase family 9 protein [Actinomycetota bacterium]|nr:glycosyltransferase family 9 protein [Actinomycetota bacterium]
MRRWREARRVLAVRLDGIGDLLMTTPALRALKASAPGRSITLLCARRVLEAAALVPEVDRSIAHDASWVKGPAPSPAAERRLVRQLRRMRFEAAVIFTVSTQSALPAATLCRLAGIPLRLAHVREKVYDLLTDPVPDPEPERDPRHEVRRQLDLVGAVGARSPDPSLSLRIPDAARRRAAELLRAAGLDPSRPWVLLHPGASAPSRRYPALSYGAAAQLLDGDGIQVLAVSGPREEPLLEAVAAAAPAVRRLPAAPTFAVLAALVEAAPVLIANNSAPAHVAAAVGTPVVDLYAWTNPQHGPWGVPSRVLNRDVPCRGCRRSVCPLGHHHCLTLVPPAEVAEAARGLLGMRATSRHVAWAG